MMTASEVVLNFVFYLRFTFRENRSRTAQDRMSADRQTDRQTDRHMHAQMHARENGFIVCPTPCYSYGTDKASV